MLQSDLQKKIKPDTTENKTKEEVKTIQSNIIHHEVIREM